MLLVFARLDHLTTFHLKLIFYRCYEWIFGRDELTRDVKPAKNEEGHFIAPKLTM